MTSIPADLKASSQTMRRALPQSLVAWLFLAPAAEKDVMVLHLVGGPRTLVAAFLETYDGVLNLLGGLLWRHSPKDD